MTIFDRFSLPYFVTSETTGFHGIFRNAYENFDAQYEAAAGMIRKKQGSSIVLFLNKNGLTDFMVMGTNEEGHVLRYLAAVHPITNDDVTSGNRRCPLKVMTECMESEYPPPGISNQAVLLIPETPPLYFGRRKSPFTYPNSCIRAAGKTFYGDKFYLEIPRAKTSQSEPIPFNGENWIHISHARGPEMRGVIRLGWVHEDSYWDEIARRRQYLKNGPGKISERIIITE